MDFWFFFFLSITITTLVFGGQIIDYANTLIQPKTNTTTWNYLNTPYLADPKNLEGEQEELKYVEVGN